MTVEEWEKLEGDWELIEGEPHKMASGSHHHGEVGGDLYTDISNYFRQRRNIRVIYDHDIHLDENTVLRPDIMVLDSNYRIGGNKFHGVPDLVVEVLSPSTMSRDLRDKFDIYQKFGVREYWIVHPSDKCIDLYLLEDGLFKKMLFYEYNEAKDSQIKSFIYPDLLIDPHFVFGDRD